eukprot:jgi/Chrzof1/5350/UNPLg00815.t1
MATHSHTVRTTFTGAPAPKKIKRTRNTVQTAAQHQYLTSSSPVEMLRTHIPLFQGGGAPPAKVPEWPQERQGSHQAKNHWAMPPEYMSALQTALRLNTERIASPFDVHQDTPPTKIRKYDAHKGVKYRAATG